MIINFFTFLMTILRISRNSNSLLQIQIMFEYFDA